MRLPGGAHGLIKFTYLTEDVAALTGQIGASLHVVDPHSGQYLQRLLALLPQQ